MYYHTDRIIEAITNAAEAPNDEAPTTTSPVWLRDRFWAPWNDQDRGVDDELVRRCRYLVPGVLVFRNDHKFSIDETSSDQLLIVLLVGETPTWGVHKVALEEAIEFFKATQSPASNDLREIPIVGPIFSGSATSIRYALNAFRAEQPPICFTILSGAASNVGIKATLDTCESSRAPADANDHVSCRQACLNSTSSPPTFVTETGPYLEFHATTIPDDLRLKALYEFLVKQLGVDTKLSGNTLTLQRVALLKETGTGYGSEPAYLEGDGGARGASGEGGSVSQPPEPALDGGLLGDDAGSSPPSETDASGADDGGYTAELKALSPPDTRYVAAKEIRFPLHISNVARAYERQDTERGDDYFAMAPSTRLNPFLDEPTEPRDIFPSLSPRTVFSNDLLLEQIVDQLTHQDIRFVGVFATDPRDTIFLARHIRDHAPDVRLFTLGSELLYSHPSYQAELNGLLVVTPYPLFGARDPAGSESSGLLFSSEDELGTFNATMVLLGKTGGLRGYPSQGDAGVREPSLWVSVVGRDGYYPLADARESDTAKLADKDDFVLQLHAEERHSEDLPNAPRSWHFLVLIYNAFCAWFALSYLVSVFRSQLIRPTWPVVGAFVENDRALAFRARHAFLMMFLGLGFFDTVVVAVRAETLESDILESVVVFCAEVGLIVATLVAALRCAGVLPASYAKQKIVPWLFRLLTGLAALLAVSWLALFASTTVTRADFVRLSNLSSGLSPLAPLTFFCASYVVWAICTLEYVRAAAPSLSSEGRLSTILSTSQEQRDIKTLEFRFLGALRLELGITPWILLVPVWVLPLWAFFLKPPSTLEGGGRDFVFSILLLLAYGIVVFNAITLLANWRRLSALLGRMARHSLAEAFGRLPDGVVRALQRQLTGRAPGVDELGVAVYQLKALAGTREKIISQEDASILDMTALSELEGLARKASETFSAEREASANGLAPAIVRSSTLDHLTSASTAIMAALKTASRRLVFLTPDSRDEGKPLLSAFGPIESLGVDASEAARAWLLLAQEFVATLVAMVVYSYVRPLRQLMTIATACSLLLLLAISSYAFEPRRLLVTVAWALIVGTVFVVGYVLVEIDRDDLLSRITRTPPGRVTIDRTFVVQLVAWGLLPLLSMVAVQYPQVSDVLFFWLKPMSKALR